MGALFLFFARSECVREHVRVRLSECDKMKSLGARLSVCIRCFDVFGCAASDYVQKNIIYG